MALWNRIIELGLLNDVRTFYNDDFPLEVRCECAEFIENRLQSELCGDINDPHFDMCAENFFIALVEQLGRIINQEIPQSQMNNNYILTKHRLNLAKQHFSQPGYNFRDNYIQIRDAIRQEEMLVQNLEAVAVLPQFEIDEKMEIRRNITDAHQSVLHNLKFAKDFQTEAQNWLIQYNFCNQKHQELMSLPDSPELQMQKHQLDELYLKCNDMEQRLLSHKQLMSTNIEQTLNNLDVIQTAVINNHLRKWQRDQVLAGNGGVLRMDVLDEIQGWFDFLCELLCNTRQMINGIINCNDQIQRQLGDKLSAFNPNFKKYYEEVGLMLHSLIVSGFMVELQPPQVMKKLTRFAATVRLLITTSGIHLSNPTVRVSILSENQARLQKSKPSPITENAGEILNNTGSLELQQTSNRHLSCTFRNMQLTKIKRTEKRGSESVMDEKFVLLFQTTLHVGDIQLNIWVMSMPFAAIVHGSREPHSWATITWDNAFSELVRMPFQVVDKVAWSKVAEALTMKFQSQNGRPLTIENLDYLREKAFRNTMATNENLLTWALFAKEHLPDRGFTFWEWYYHIMRLTMNHLREAWSKGHIIGFISKRNAEEMLKQSPPGTFLLRFSDSESGGITIAFSQANEPRVLMLAPFTQKDLEIRSLTDRIQDLNELTTLYPDVPKDLAFPKIVSTNNKDRSSSTGTNGTIYRKTEIKTTIAGREMAMTATPASSIWGASPDYSTGFDMDFNDPSLNITDTDLNNFY